MSREVRFTLDDDQFAQLSELKDRHGYTWKGLMIEGAQKLTMESADFSDRDRLQKKVAELEEEFGDRDHHCSFRISSVRAESGDDFLGVRVRLMDTDHMRLVTDLENIDRSLYDEGYNTAWAYEPSRPSDDAFIPEGEYLYDGAIAALLIERGTPKTPSVPEPHRKARTHQNIH